MQNFSNFECCLKMPPKDGIFSYDRREIQKGCILTINVFYQKSGNNLHLVVKDDIPC